MQESRVADATLRALGARPVRLPVTRVNVARYDGLEQRISTIDFSLKHGGYVSANVKLCPRPLVLFANANVFASLTPNQQSALRRAATGLSHAQTSLVIGLDRESGGNLCRAGRVKLKTARGPGRAAPRRAAGYNDLERDPTTE